MKWVDEEEADDLAQLGVSDEHGTGHDQVLRFMAQESRDEKMRWLKYVNIENQNARQAVASMKVKSESMKKAGKT